MFNQLTNRLKKGMEHLKTSLKGERTLTQGNITPALKPIRDALLEADVALSVVTQFIEQVAKEAEGQKATKKVSAGDALTKVVQDQLTEVLGGKDKKELELNLKAAAPVVIMMVGLQGSGKTTSAGKLANLLKNEHKKSVALVSTDVYRPAAIDQLETLCKQIDAHFLPSSPDEKPKKIVERALKEAKKAMHDVLIIDTAGRLHIDDALMTELKELSAISNPTETLLVVDSMMGQDAATMAAQFNEQLELTGSILTKTDGDARGGAALSMRMITKKPIKFMGVGEKIDNLEPFHPKRLASRILGMGDIVTLVERAQKKVDEKKTEKLAKKVGKKKGKAGIFNFNDMMDMINQARKMGSMSDIMSKLPMDTSMMPNNPLSMFDDESVKKLQAVVHSMTLSERAFPATLNGSRKRRIAKGCGLSMQEITRTIRMLDKTKKMFRQASGQKIKRRMAHLSNQMPAGMNPDSFPFEDLDK